MFYFAAKEELAPWRPISKFLCVKSVVFFTWWQSIMINMFMTLTDYIQPENSWTDKDVANAIQVWIIYHNSHDLINYILIIVGLFDMLGDVRRISSIYICIYI